MGVSYLVKKVGLGGVALGVAYYLFILEPEPSSQPKAVSAQRVSHRVQFDSHGADMDGARAECGGGSCHGR